MDVYELYFQILTHPEIAHVYQKLMLHYESIGMINEARAFDTLIEQLSDKNETADLSSSN